MHTLVLEPTQRLNIIAGLDRLECQGRREGWAVCALQKCLDLTDEERAIIGWRKQRTDDGREYAMWSNGSALPPRSYDLEDQDIQRICKAMDVYPVVLVRDRAWWEPLTAQLPAPQQDNGTEQHVVPAAA